MASPLRMGTHRVRSQGSMWCVFPRESGSHRMCQALLRKAQRTRETPEESELGRWGPESGPPGAGSVLTGKRRIMGLDSGHARQVQLSGSWYTQGFSLSSHMVMSFYFSHTTLVSPNMDLNLSPPATERKMKGVFSSDDFLRGWRGEPRNAVAPSVEND